jgi:hypothetical protein
MAKNIDEIRKALSPVLKKKAEKPEKEKKESESIEKLRRLMSPITSRHQDWLENEKLPRAEFTAQNKKETKGKDWLETAKKDPDIDRWWSGMKAEYPEFRKHSSVEENLKQTQREFEGGEGAGYDTKRAIEQGVRPKMIPEDYKMHWVGRDPEHPERFLKGKKHKTRWMSEADTYDDKTKKD